MVIELGVRDRVDLDGSPGPTPAPPSPLPAAASAAPSLALDALCVARWARSGGREAGTWSWRIGAQVERVRAQLAPIGSRAGLEASYEREAFRSPAFAGGSAAVPDLEVSPVRIAYALRWLELPEGTDGPD